MAVSRRSTRAAGKAVSLAAAAAFYWTSRSAERERAQRGAGDGSPNGIRGQDIGELVDAVRRQAFEIVELQDVHALLHEQIDVHRIEAAAHGLRVGWFGRHVFEAGGVRAE